MKNISDFQERYDFNPSTDELPQHGGEKVYKARDTERGAYVALKKRDKQQDVFNLKRCYELSKRLSPQSNILPFLDYHCFSTKGAEEVEFLSMDFCEKGDLDAFLKREKPSGEALKRWVSGILNGLVHLHAQGFLHGHLTASKILLKQEQDVLIPQLYCDGLIPEAEVSQMANRKDWKLQEGLAYSAPEQLLEKPLSSNLDFWAFGLLLYQMCTGTLPFEEAYKITELEALTLANSGAEGLPELETVPQPYQKMIRRCLVLDSSKRVKDGAELLQLLKEDVEEQAVAKEELSSNTVAAQAAQKPVAGEDSKQVSKLPLGKLGGVAAVVLLLLALAWYFMGGSAGPVQTLEAGLVPVKGGSLKLGCTSEQDQCDKDEYPAHTVQLQDFEISQHEVTQAQWVAVMGNNPSKHQDCPDCPVEQVNWHDAERFTQKLSKQTGDTYRLPTEAEWEYAARGGQQSKGYRFAGGDVLVDVAWCGANSGQQTHPVGQKQPNELGLYDMAGNVWEWCLDGPRDYSSSARSSPQGADGDRRLLRGASWYDGGNYARVSNRFPVPPSPRNHANGFRVVRVTN